MKRIELIGLVLVIALCCASRTASQWGSVSLDQKVTSLVSTGDVLFAGTSTNGVYRSTDDGLNWSVASAGLPTLNIRALAVSGPRVYAGTDSGVFVSTNGGISWSAINQGLSDFKVYALAARYSLVFAGTMNGIFRSSDSGANWTKVVLPSGYATLIYAFAMNESSVHAGTEGYHGMMYRSTDAGITWSTTTNLGTVWALAMVGSRVIAGTYNGVRVTQDDGATWLRTNAGLGNLTIKSLVAQNGYLLAGTQGGVYVSTDSATSWMSLNTGLTDTAILAMAVHGQNLFAGSDGKIWRRTMPDLNAVPGTPDLHAPSNQASGQRISVNLRWGKPDLTSFFHLQVGTDSTFESGVVVDSAAYPDTVIRLSGLSLSQRFFWRVAAKNSHGVGTLSDLWSFETLASAPSSPSLASPAANGLVAGGTAVLVWHRVPDASSYRIQVADDSSFTSPLIDSTIADSWTQISLAPLTRCYWRVQAVNDFGPGPFSAIRLFTVMRSPALPIRWEKVIGPNEGSLSMVSPREGIVISIGHNGAIQRTQNDGTTWTAGPTSLYHKYFGYYPMVVTCKGNIIAGSLTGMLRSLDNGETWQGLPSKALALAVDSSGRIYKSGIDGEICWSTDEGSTWSPPVQANYAVAPITFIGFLHNRNIIASSDVGGTYISTNQGESWEQNTDSRFGEKVTAISVPINGYTFIVSNYSLYRIINSDTSRTIIPMISGVSGNIGINSHGSVYTVAWKSVFQSTDVGGSWTSTSDGIDSTGVLKTIYISPNDAMFVGAVNCIFRSTSLSSVSGTKGVPSADDYDLSQNYPNPFNPSTTIRYGLPARSHVTLMVFNTLGQQVAVLQNGEQEAGYHEVLFDAHGLPSGVYFYRLQAGSFTKTQRLLLIR